jgi:hypothetical protein
MTEFQVTPIEISIDGREWLVMISGSFFILYE